MNFLHKKGKKIKQTTTKLKILSVVTFPSHLFMSLKHTDNLMGILLSAGYPIAL